MFYLCDNYDNMLFKFYSPLLTWQQLQRKTCLCCLGLDLLRYLTCNVLFQKISIRTPQMFFWFEPPPPHTPPEILLSIGFILSFRNFRFSDPHPFEFPMTIHGEGMDIFWNHTIIETLSVFAYQLVVQFEN